MESAGSEGEGAPVMPKLGAIAMKSIRNMPKKTLDELSLLSHIDALDTELAAKDARLDEEISRKLFLQERIDAASVEQDQLQMELAAKNRTIKRVRETSRTEMMRTLSDKLSMEEIATVAYAVEAALEGKQ